MIKDVKIPEISENVESGKVVNVLVQVGDRVDIDDVLVEFETEKALVDIPSTAAGKIAEMLAKEGDEMQVGDVIARVDTEAESSAGDAAEDESGAAEKQDQAAESAEETPEEVSEETPEAETESSEVEAEDRSPDEGRENRQEKDPKKAAPKSAPSKPEKKAGEQAVPASPSVRRFARELGVDLHAVQASGPGGRITEADIKAYVKDGDRAGRSSAGEELAAGTIREPELPDFSRWGEIETQELESVRRITAANMSTAWRTVPHVTQFDQADITGLQEFIRKNADQVSQKDGKLTVTAILAKVCAAALIQFERFNASIDPTKRQLILKRYVHIGIAADTPRGLLVPVVRNADQKSITRLAVEISDLAGRARNKKLKPDEMEGGTFTISNQGGIGGVGFAPIVFWPQVAILGVSRASIQPRYIEGEFRPRSMLPLSLSFDHRAIDGADAARFLRWVCESLEQPLTMLLE